MKMFLACVLSHIALLAHAAAPHNLTAILERRLSELQFGDNVASDWVGGSWNNNHAAVQVPPSLCGGKSHQEAGYIAVGDMDGKYYFYWFAQSRSDPESDPMILWLSGGPGCSSIVALLRENGPCRVNADAASTTSNPYSWNSNANVIWLDQPTGVGFSYAIYPNKGLGTEFYDTNEEEVSSDVYDFLRQFYKTHAVYNSRPFYIFGESYGGHYVPVVANLFQTRQDAYWHKLQAGKLAKNAPANHMPRGLTGIGIGNGIVNPRVQFKYYTKFIKDNPYDRKLVTQAVFQNMVKKAPLCQRMIDACEKDHSACARAKTFCHGLYLLPLMRDNRNLFDVRVKQCVKQPICYDFTKETAWCRLKQTDRALGIAVEDNTPWKVCNLDVNAGFIADWMRSYTGAIPALLKKGVRVLVYAGDADYICNWMGNKAWTKEMQWEHKAAYNKAKDVDWLDKEVANDKTGIPSTKPAWGQLRSYGGLTFLKIARAGHMVPMDKPREALQMLSQWFNKEPGFT